MAAPDIIYQLVENFALHRRTYMSQDYNETQVRREFVDPFFEALGWDVINKAGYAHAYKDVIHEDAIQMSGATKAPDYAFRIGGTRKFFVEAKKPAVNLKDAISPAYQLRRYAWSAKLPLSILTDFEEFTVYDCRLKPALADQPSTGRIHMLTYREYPAHWDEIESVFSRQAVLKGSFDQYAESATGKHGTAEVDHAFLAEIERWRDLLARNIALRNPSLTQHDLNYAIQMTIDRLIFLRICEDRGIEFYGQLQALLNGSEVYPRLCQLFRNADDRYNSGLFHFRGEKGQSASPDALSLGLTIDDKPLKDILGNLYYPESPYEFSVLPTELLGQVYEQFLGKVIRLTSAHHAVVEDKPEVKKAGGVFYTPTFIVDYIVKHTLGELLKERKPGDVGTGKGTPIRVLDMACGSGSFLLGVYQYLLDWYLQGYTDSDPEKWAKGSSPQLVQVTHGDWRLTTAERKRILLDHIYGVDIDPQAVEVTKLSLLLKVLEGESQDSVGKQLSMFHQRALPDLGMNIKCGNSLIGPDFYTGKQSTFLSPEEKYRINAFDWQREFAHVFDRPARYLWLVTFVTHNSRVSERMVTYGVKADEPLLLDAAGRLLAAQYISEACRNHGIPVVAWDVLPDHVHMLLAAVDEHELDEHVRKIKGFSSYSLQRARGWGEGNHVWAQKYHHHLITDPKMLENAYGYVMDNHLKHAEQWGQELIDSFEVPLSDPDSAPHPNTSDPKMGLSSPSSTRGLSSSSQTMGLSSSSSTRGLSSSSSTRGLSPLLHETSSSPSSPDPLLPHSITSSTSLKSIRDALCITPDQACQPTSGGFDVIIGNPPYRMLQPHNTEQEILAFLRKHYIAAEYKLEMFHMFLQKSISLLAANGYHGYILPATILNNVYAEPLRKWVSNHCCILYISVANKRIFENADVHTTVLMLRKEQDNERIKNNVILTTHRLNREFINITQTYNQILQRRFSDLPGNNWNILINENNYEVLRKITSQSIQLGELSKINRGLITGDRKKDCASIFL